MHHSVVINLTSSSLLCCSRLLLYCYIKVHCVFALRISLLLFPAVLLSFVRTSRQREVGVGFLMNSAVCEDKSWRTNVMSVLCRNWPTLQLALPPSAVLHFFSFPLSSTSHRSLLQVGVCFSLALSYFYLIPFFQLLWESQCWPACSSWISANVVLPAPSCISPLSFSLSHPSLPPSLPCSLTHWHVTSSGLSQQHQRLAPTLTSHHFTWAFNCCPNELDSSAGTRPEKTTISYNLATCLFIRSLKLVKGQGKGKEAEQNFQLSLYIKACCKTKYSWSN